MRPKFHISLAIIAAIVLGGATAPVGAQDEESTSSASAASDATGGSGASDAATAQILLDRANFSPGSIDGIAKGVRTENALKAFQKANNLDPTGQVDDKTLAALTQAAGGAEPYTNYTIKPEDVNGPFAESVPDDWKKMAEMDRLSYTSPQELLAEKFHVTEEFLKQLNPQASFKAGESIKVPNVEPFQAPAPGAESGSGKEGSAEKIVISGADKSLTVLGEGGKIAFFAPITPGSSSLPLPSGELKVKGVAKNPKYSFDPEIIKEADVKEKLKIPPGPNNPVGVVWVDLSKENYGIHGTPEPSKIGYSTSHGCVRLTNWDAIKVASWVKPGTPVVFE